MRLAGDTFYDPEYDADLRTFWVCEECGEQNSRLDGECQFCDGPSSGGDGLCVNCPMPATNFPGGAEVGYCDLCWNEREVRS